MLFSGGAHGCGADDGGDPPAAAAAAASAASETAAASGYDDDARDECDDHLKVPFYISWLDFILQKSDQKGQVGRPSSDKCGKAGAVRLILFVVQEFVVGLGLIRSAQLLNELDRLIGQHLEIFQTGPT